jgi:hypothetical protein
MGVQLDDSVVPWDLYQFVRGVQLATYYTSHGFGATVRFGFQGNMSLLPVEKSTVWNSSWVPFSRPKLVPNMKV